MSVPTVEDGDATPGGTSPWGGEVWIVEPAGDTQTDLRPTLSVLTVFGCP